MCLARSLAAEGAEPINLPQQCQKTGDYLGEPLPEEQHVIKMKTI